MNRPDLTVCCAVTSLLMLTACSQGSDTDGSSDTVSETTTNQSDMRAAPPRSSSQQPAETIPPTLITAPDIDQSTNQAQVDQWFFSTLHSAGIPDSEDMMRQLRRDVCSMIEIQRPVEEISVVVAERGYTEEQVGVIIGASMISSCRDTPAIVDRQHLPEDLDQPS